MSHDDIDNIPSIVPGRDRDEVRPAAKGGAKRPAGGAGNSKDRRGAASRRASDGGAGIWARLFITLALVVAAVACAWAWQLQEELRQAGFVMEQYEQRIGDLEDRLSDTDEGLSQNTATMAVKIKELYSEVDKLWASAWRRNKAKIEALEKQSAANTKKVDSTASSLTKDEARLKSVAGDIAKLKTVAGDLERLMASAKTNQREVERVADSLNSINLEFAKLGKRVESNEEWVGSVNAFRRQVNSTLTRLQASIRTLEAAP
jgi:chromosome segregation ATPase